MSIKRGYIGPGCIKGAHNQGETPIEALQREAMVEMGYSIELRDAPVT